ncbi:alkaline phosphatase D family protein [Thalassotalea fonticola]|uniref:Alkaline phosphatase D family protein n=1 Tax=Thalassotalea fonticola TaxID=3065649 RepID=A0ABZ0GL78_9GAMM|nr:alkaline phosphatase D family protein [Colwelliaceae bacterium S1-1]
MKIKTLSHLSSMIVAAMLSVGCDAAKKDIVVEQSQDNSYSSSWSNIKDGHYLGSDLWANPVQDWRIKNGELECNVSGGERNIFLLTKSLNDASGNFDMAVTVRPLAEFLAQPTKGYVGFRLGVNGQFNDYRDSAVHGRGMKVGIDSKGTLFIGKQEGEQISLNEQPIRLHFTGTTEAKNSALTLTAFDANNQQLAQLTRNVASSVVAGGTGLACHAGDNRTREGMPFQRGKTKRAGNIGFAFSDWTINGDVIATNADRTFGPIAFSMYTLDKNTMKMTAQMLPVPKEAGTQITLELQSADTKTWQQVASSTMVDDSRTAHFSIEDWLYKQDMPYRIGYQMADRAGNTSQHYYQGKISKEPEIGSQLKVASLSCHLDLGFPHQDMVSFIDSHNTDLVLFTGDQYYEGNAGYGVQKAPLAAANLDYLRKWYQFGWAFRDLYRDVPSVFLVDDHDVFHGNIWGDEGKAASGKPGADIQDSGGFKMPAPWVNAVQRSMTSHMPDPVDPTPVKQDISVYYTDLNYAGVSFAILEDRKWKTSPRKALPDAKIKNGFSNNLDWDAKESGDTAGLNLLGERQMNFLNEWAQDWSADARMKSVVSQTLFSSVQTRPKSDIINFKDRGMGPVAVGDYPEEDITVQDFDTNGWPQTPRQNALKLMRKGSAFHIAGDTHLGVTFQYGIDGWNNGAWAIGSPAISNTWPRRWFPKSLPLNYVEGQPRNLGEYYDGFGNEITVKAVANPTVTDIEPVRINQRAPGYNILTFDTAAQTLKVEAWPRWVDPQADDASQFKGWPMTFNQKDNGYPSNGHVLPTISGLSKSGAVIQVENQQTQEIEYTLRFTGETISPRAFSDGLYTVRLYNEEMELIKTLADQRTQK